MKNRIEELRRIVKEHDVRYDQSMPIISDSEYDELYLQLERLEKQFPEYFDPESPTQKIVTTVVTGLQEVRHRTPMLSQQKFTLYDEVEAFIKSLRGYGNNNIKIMIQEKLDGITIVVSYLNGRMIEAVSRGNGEVGEDLFHNVRTFENLPKVIPFKGRLEIRAEAVLPFEAFNKMNVDGKYSNPRNLVSGSLRQLDSSKVAGKGFKAIVYDLIYAEGMYDDDFDNQDTNRLLFLAEQGFEIVSSVSFDNIDDAILYIKYYGEEIRRTLPHMIDGMVLKVSNLTLREELGNTSKSPRWAAAFKFKSLDATTILLGITDQVGKTGQITPVAELETVNIDGVNISRATLHNYSMLAKKDVRIGDTVLVERANDVIPQIVGPVVENRTGEEIIKPAPEFCPVCGSITEFDGENLYCTGLNCTPQIEGKLQHFVSRDAMNIDGLGEKMVSMLYSAGIVNTVTDIYNLEDKANEICELEGFGKKKFDKMIEGVEESKKRELPNVLYSLSIRNIGLGSSKRISKVFSSLGELLELNNMPLQAAMDKLLTVEDFGEIKANSVIDFFINKENAKIIRELIALDVNPVVEEVSGDNPLTGKVFVVTGKVEKFANRNAIQAKIESLGGKVSDSVSKDTSYLINNDVESSSSKNVKARKLNIPILSEDDFINLIEG